MLQTLLFFSFEGNPFTLYVIMGGAKVTINKPKKHIQVITVNTTLK